MGKVALIAGASGGFGGVLARTLGDKGMTVYGTMRHPEAGESSEPFPMLPLEITSSSSVELCVDEVLRRAGRIDVSGP